MADVDLKIGADTSEVDRGAQNVTAKLGDLSNSVKNLQSEIGSFGSTAKEAFENANTSLGGLQDGFSKLAGVVNHLGDGGWAKVLLGAGGIAGVVTAVYGAIKAFHEMVEQFQDMKQNAEEASLSLVKFQELQYALTKSGDLDKDSFASGLETASKKLNDLSHHAGELGKFLDANNVKWKDASGHVITVDEYLQKAVDLLEKSGDNWQDAFKAGELMGFSKDWVRALKSVEGGLNNLGEEAHKTGNVISEETIDKTIEFEEKWKAAATKWSDWIKNAIIEATPYIDVLINKWANLFGTHDLSEMTGGAKSNLMGIADTTEKAAGSLKKFGDMPLPSLVTADSALKEMSTYMDQLNAKAVAAKKKVDETKKDDDKDRSSIVFPKTGQDTTELTKLQEQLDAIRANYERIKVLQKNAVDTFKETETQKVTHLLAALAERKTAEQAVFDKEIALAADNANKQEQIRRKMMHEMDAIQKEQLALEAENLKRSAQEWQSVTQTITSAFTSQLRGLLAHTTSWSTAMKNIAADLVLKIIEEFAKLAIVKPLSSILANSFSAPTELFSGFMKAIGGMLGPLMAGFTSFFAPVMGPAAPAAGAAAAAAEVAVAKAAVGSFEVGTDFVPRTGYALVHQGEAIIPASQNMAGGGSAGAAISFNVQAFDSAGVQAFFNRYGPQIAKSLTAHMNQNPSFQR